MKKRMLMFLLAVVLAGWVLPVTAYGAESVVVSFRVVGGTWEDGETEKTVYYEPGYVLSEDDVPDDMVPGTGYGGGSWQVDPVGETVTEDRTFLFRFQKVLTVAFDANQGQWEDGEAVRRVSALAGDPCEEWPEEPCRDGFTFAGWCLSSSGLGSKFDEDSPVEENLTLYAAWRKNCWLTLDLNDGSGDTEQIELPGGMVWFPEEPARDGWKFDHWNTAADGSGEVLEEDAVLKSNTTAYAQWRRIFCLLFDGNSEVSGVERQYIEENPGTLSYEFTAPDLDRTGHTLLNWNTQPDGSGQEVAVGEQYPVNVDSNPATLYAQWERNTYQVSFEGTDAVLDCLWNDTLSEEDFPEPAPMEGNFRFAGWVNAKGQSFSAETPVTENMTVSPHWVQQVDVTFQIVNGTWKENGEDNLVITLDLGAALADHLPTPVPEDDFKASGKWDVKPVKASEGAVFTYTCDARKKLKITFDTGDEPLEILEGRCATLPVPTRTGFRFVGWYTSKNGGELFDDQTEFSKNILLYAHWMPVFTLTYNANGGENPPAVQTVDDDGETHTFTVAPEIPTRPGYSFQGWSEDKDAKTADFHGGDPCSAARDVTLYAVWKKDIVLATVTFLDRGAETGKLTIQAGTTPGGAMPEQPTWQDHRFLGWNTQEDGDGEILTKETEIKENMTVYAIWEEIIQATVTFIDRGREVDWFALEAGDSVGGNMPVDPSRQGFAFLGWQSEEGESLEASTPIEESLTVYAAWEKITRGTVTFVDGETELHQITLDLGAKIGDNMPDDPVRESHRFLGWNTRDDGTGSKLYRSTVLRGDLTVWAQWEEIEYVTLTLHDRFADSLTLTLEQNTKPGDRFPNNPTRAGYTFKGWYTEQSGQGQKVTKSTRIQENTDVYAYWRQKNTTNAKTGDAFNLALWTGVLIVSGGALLYLRKRKH